MRIHVLHRLWVVAGLSATPASAASVSVSPTNTTLKPNTTRQFSATVTGAGDVSVVWLVNGIRGGAPSIGIIDANGLFTSPATVPAATRVTVEAASVAAPSSFGSARVVVSASSAGGATYYVAPTGNDAAAGSANAPWRTIQHAVDTIPAGATVLVHGGVYRELVTLRHSGSPTAGFLSVTAAPGEAPVIDGTGLAIPNGQNGLVTITDASWVRIEGLELRNYASTTVAVPVGLYVLGRGDHIELRRNHIHNIKTDEATQNRNALGIAVYGTSGVAPISQLIIDGNKIDHLKSGFSESMSLSGNVSLWQVTGNTIHDNDNIGVNIEGFFRTAPTAVDQARNGLIAGNTVYNISSRTNKSYRGSLGADGLYVDGGADVTVQQNLVHDVDIGIELASEVKGRATSGVVARSNVVYRSLIAGVSLGGAAAGNGGTKDCAVVNNTFFADDTTRSGSGELQIQYNATSNTVFNNIFSANKQGLLVNSFGATSGTPAALDHNIYFSDAPGASQWIWARKSYATLPAYRAASGQDPNSSFADPKFVDTATPDLHLSGTSPAIGAGIDLGLALEGLVDFDGKPRTRGSAVDAGAFAR